MKGILAEPISKVLVEVKAGYQTLPGEWWRMKIWPGVEGDQIQRTGILNRLGRILAKVGHCRNKPRSPKSSAWLRREFRRAWLGFGQRPVIVYRGNYVIGLNHKNKLLLKCFHSISSLVITKTPSLTRL